MVENKSYETKYKVITNFKIIYPTSLGNEPKENLILNFIITENFISFEF